MSLLVLGVLLWAGTHLFPAVAVDVRSRLIERFGSGPYRGGFALLIVISVVLIILGWKAATPMLVYRSPSLGPPLTGMAMAVALILFFCGGMMSWLRVRDEGAGIAPGIQDRIFDPFFTTKDVGQGTGLGLATVHGIVTAHQGFIELESEPPRGTTFRVGWPVAAATAGAPDPDVATPAAAERCRILVVEDEEHLSTIVRFNLEAAREELLAVEVRGLLLDLLPVLLPPAPPQGGVPLHAHAGDRCEGRVDVGQNQRHPLRGEPARHLGSDSPGGAGDDGSTR